jgi:HEAT repeat protein
VPVLNVNGINYRVFLLDINQKASAPLLSLDQLQIFVGASGNLTGYNTTSRQLASNKGEDAMRPHCRPHSDDRTSSLRDLASDDLAKQVTACYELAATGDQSVLPNLINRLTTTNNDQVRTAVKWAIQEIGFARRTSHRYVIDLFSSNDPDLQLFALSCLSPHAHDPSIGRELIPSLLRLFSVRDRKVQRYAAAILIDVISASNNIDAAPTIDLPEGCDSGVMSILSIVAVLATKTCVANDLVPFLDNPDGLVRDLAAFGLGRLKDTSGVGALERALDDSDPAVRSSAIMALSGFANLPTQTTARIHQREQDCDPFVREKAEWANRVFHFRSVNKTLDEEA